MPRVRLFGPVRVAAGTGRDELAGDTVGDLLDSAVLRYGVSFADLLPACRVWVNGEPADGSCALGPADEVAILPPVSGGAGGQRPPEGGGDVRDS